MACPVHIWVPMMAVAAPFARVARNRIQVALAARRAPEPEAEAPRERTRWAPVGQHAPEGDSTR